MRTRLVAVATFPLLLLLACGAAPETAPVAPTASFPPPEAKAAPSLAPAPEPSRPPVTPSKLSVFAEGWGLSVAIVGDKPALFDRYFGGWGDVDGGKVHLATRAYDGVQREDGDRLTLVSSASTTATVLLVARPGAQLQLYGGGEARWTPLGPISFRGYSRVLFAGGPGDELTAVPIALARASVMPLSTKAVSKIELDGDTARAVPSELEPLVVHATPAGELFLVGSRRPSADAAPTTDRALAAHFAPGATTPTVAELPEGFPSARPERVSVRICGRPDVGVYVVRDSWVDLHVSKAYAVGYRDDGWKVVSGPSEDTTGVNLANCAVAPDGSLWTAFTAVVGGSAPSRVFRMTPDGVWSTVPLPEIAPMASKPKLTPAKGKKGDWNVGSTPLAGAPGLLLTSVFSAGTGEIWIGATRTAGGRQVAIDDAPFNEPRNVLLRTGEPQADGPVAWDRLAGDAVALLARKAPPSQPKAAVASAKPAPTPLPSTPPEPAGRLVAATPACSSVFVALYAVAPATPADYDFPMTHDALATRPALARAAFLETEVNGKRTLGAMVPSVAFGKDLVDLIQAKIRGSKPQLLCGEPRVLRSVPMDLPNKTTARAHSAVPSLAEWNGVGETTVKGSSALGCETKRVREWIRISCRGKSKAGATPKSVTVDRGAATSEVFTFAAGNVVSLVYPLGEGTDFTATFAFTDGPHVLTSTWPAGAPQPATAGELK